MAFRRLSGGGGNILKWDTPGQVVEGRLIGTKRGKVFNGRPSTLAIIAQADGVQLTVPLPTVLEGRFLEHNVQAGALLRITYIGLQTGEKGGASYKAFDVDIDDGTEGDSAGASVPAPAPTPAPAPAPITGGGGVPSYEALVTKLREVSGPRADAQLAALAQLFPDAPARTEALIQTLKTLGVSA